MKKLPMIIAIVVSIFSAQGAMAQNNLALNDAGESMNYEYEHQEFTEISAVESPLAVQETAARDFQKFRIIRAYMSKDNTYKIVLKDKNDNTKIVFANTTGELIRPNDNKS